jgi:hypothetical protein
MTVRERYLKFKKLHPDKIRKYNLKWRMKQRKPCRLCGKTLPFPSQGRTRCVGCAEEQTRRNNAAIVRKRQKAFIKYKEKRGCKLCGYNKYGGSLDFHHIKEKESRIQASDWNSRNRRWKNESKKCILVCKNCHYELHKAKDNGDVTV